MHIGESKSLGQCPSNYRNAKNDRSRQHNEGSAQPRHG
jgi:hypothetical protein